MYSCNYFFDLPFEIVSNIISFLDIKDILNLSLINKEFCDRIEGLWKELCYSNKWKQALIDNGNWKNTAIRNASLSEKEKINYVTKTNLKQVWNLKPHEISQLPLYKKRGNFGNINFYPLKRLSYIINNCIGSDIINKRKKERNTRSINIKKELLSHKIERKDNLIYYLKKNGIKFSKNKIFEEPFRKSYNSFSQASLKYYYYEYIFKNKYNIGLILKECITKKWIKENTSYSLLREQFLEDIRGLYFYSLKNKLPRDRFIYDKFSHDYLYDPLYIHNEIIKLSAIQNYLDNEITELEENIMIPLGIFNYISTIIFIHQD